MKIKIICPKCHREEKIKAIWSWLFHEDYIDWKAEVKKFETDLWQKEMPKILQEIEETENKIKALEDKIMMTENAHDFLNLKSLNQHLMFLVNRYRNLIKQNNQNYVIYPKCGELREQTIIPRLD